MVSNLFYREKRHARRCKKARIKKEKHSLGNRSETSCLLLIARSLREQQAACVPNDQ